MHQTELLDPKNDYVFKRLFADAPGLLVALINAVRYAEPAITAVEVLNPGINPEELAGKYIVLDLLAEDVHGQRYNIEMQVRRYNAWSARSAYYLARLLGQQLVKGEDYEKLKPAIGIHLLDFDLFQHKAHQEQACWHFEMRDRDQPGVKLGNELQLDIVELRKADRLGLAPAPLKAWVTFIEHWQETAAMADIDYEPVKEAMNKLITLSADEEARRLAFVRERAIRDEASLLKQARQEGMHSGVERALRCLIQVRFGAIPAWADERLSLASDEQLDGWIVQILSANSLEDLFAETIG
ncbi:MAG: Rpn family recombination-promoting nuclease/putative transposase [Gammaproteobacteria bacterium]|mgnify:CR=1 FL=1|nr:Rpn family recombination-promoting nuclease/putative transposase [Gammaproteobacteria bacterium]